MPLKHFEILLNHFYETGENLLDDYSCVKHLAWNSDSENEFSLEVYKIKSESVSKIREFKMIDPEDIRAALIVLKKGLQSWTNHQNHLLKEPRRLACIYTAKEKVKSEIFSQHGKACLCCGSLSTISLDHIIPVSKGGKNSIDNLQPLCRSCNSRKSDTTIDYRKL
jgi:5-methylcytosine-specific restriction endonuclease McrA